MRDEVKQLLKLGPLPSTDEVMAAASEQFDDKLKSFEKLTKAIAKPVTNEEACALVTLFGPDECFGGAWALVHLIESAPGWPIKECLKDDQNEWVRNLKERAIRGGRQI